MFSDCFLVNDSAFQKNYWLLQQSATLGIKDMLMGQRNKYVNNILILNNKYLNRLIKWVATVFTVCSLLLKKTNNYAALDNTKQQGSTAKQNETHSRFKFVLGFVASTKPLPTWLLLGDLSMFIMLWSLHKRKTVAETFSINDLNQH